MRFTDAYAACPVCSPTRASVLTGKYPARLHLTDWITGHVDPDAQLKVPDWTKHLKLSEVTIAEALKPLGYVSASIGKWHLGSEDFWPDKQGFDENIAGYDGGQPPSYNYPYERKNRKFNTHIPTLKGGDKGEYLTDRLTDEAIGFIGRNKEKPFFLYLSHYAVHTPIEGKETLAEKYRRKADADNLQNNPVYGAMVESVDQSIGRVVDEIERLGLTENTVFIFMSDNGGLIGEGQFKHVTSNLPLREGKGTAYEGGVREPMIISWQGMIKPGVVSNAVVTSVDFYPTILEMAGAEKPSGQVIDGISLMPILTGNREPEREAIYWHYPHYHPLGARPYGAIRKGDYKLIEFYEDWRVELYNLRMDIGEQQDLKLVMQDKVNELRTMLHDWRKKVDAQMPVPNPAYRRNPDSASGS